MAGNRFWVGGTGTWDASSTANWALTSGGAPGAPAPNSTDFVFFDANSGTGTCTTAAGSTCFQATLNSSTLGLTLGANHTMGSTFTLTLGTLTLQTFTLSCGAFSSSNTNARTIAFGTGNITLTGNGLAVWGTATSTNLTVTGTPVVNSTYSGSTGTRTFGVGNTAGATEANSINFNISAGSDNVDMFGSGMRDVNFTGFSGTWGATGVTKTLYGSLTLSTGMSVVGGTPTLTFAATSGVKTITTNGKTIDWAITFNGVGGTFQFADALTQGSTRAFTITNGNVRLKSGTTSTVGSFATGAGTTQRTLQSTVAGEQATLSDASGTNTATYLTIQDINATGGATWNAFLSSNNVNGGNNTGWDFNSLQIGLYMYNARKSKRILI